VGERPYVTSNAIRRYADAFTIGILSRMSVTPGSPSGAGGSLRPNRVSIWPTDDGRYGVDFTYHGPTGYVDAERAEVVLGEAGVRTQFRQELDQAWTVRFGPIERDDMRALLDRYAW
jgi:hypothetical protein